MSLHKFAEQVASQGRGDDSLLVHMTPDEVRKLQQFAEANGTTLTINPTTGLPEAGMLSDLFKAIAPIALGAFLGPAGAAIGGGFMSAGMAGLAVGGITTLATGSLSRGLMAGLGAYGGAGLGESLMGAGTGGLAATDIAAQQAAGSFPTLAEGATQEQIAKYATDVGALRDAAVSKAGEAGFMSRASAGLGAIADNPAAYGKDLFKYGSAAATPIMAGAMVPTTTDLPNAKDTGYIRQFDYNINPETGKPDPLYGMRAMTPVKASEFGNKTFQGQRELFRQQNPNPYQNPYELGVGSLNQPPLQQPLRMNTGGIVALANGGSPTVMADNDLFMQTDDSLDAYNFLIGRGKNLTQRTATADRPVMRRYDEAILGRQAVPRATPVTSNTITIGGVTYNLTDPTNPPPADSTGTWEWSSVGRRWVKQTTTAGANTYRNVGANTYQNAGGGDPVTNPFSDLTPAEQTAFYNANPPFATATQIGQTLFAPTIFGMIQNALVPGFQAQQNTIASGPVGVSNNQINSITGLAQAPNNSIPVVDLSTMSAASVAANDADVAAAVAANDAAVADSVAAATDASLGAAGISNSGTGGGGGGGDGGGTGAGAGTGNAMAMGGATGYAIGGGLGSLGTYSDGGRLLKGPGDGVSDSIPATIGR